MDTIGYVRVSTEQQATEQKTSLSDQRRLVIEHARKLGRVLDASMIFEDPGVSGATAEGRPGFMAMLSYCQSNQRSASNRGVVVVLNDSRFGRFDDPEEAGHWRFVLKRLGWIVRFAEGDDVEDTIARGVLRFIGSAQASEYRATLKRTAKRAARSTAEKGLWQQEAPFGYRRLATRTDGAQRVLEIGQRKSADEVSRLTPGPATEQQAVKWMFEAYASGTWTLGRMMDELDKKIPDRAWSRSTVGAILKNPAYAGDVVWCRRTADNPDRIERKVRDKSQWVVVANAHPAIISRELFKAVQQRLAANKDATRAANANYLFSGILDCASCGNKYTGGGGPKGPKENPDYFKIYRCAGAMLRKPACARPEVTIRKRWLEPVIINTVAHFVALPSTQEMIGRITREMMLAAKDTTKDRRSALERDKKHLAEQMRRLVGSIASGTLTEREAAATAAELRARIASVEGEIEKTRFADRASDTAEKEIQRVTELARNFPLQVRTMSGADLRELIRPWINKATIDREKRQLILTLWKVPGVSNLMDLSNVPERGGQYYKKGLTVRRVIPLPRAYHESIAEFRRRVG